MDNHTSQIMFDLSVAIGMIGICFALRKIFTDMLKLQRNIMDIWYYVKKLSKKPTNEEQKPIEQ